MTDTARYLQQLLNIVALDLCERPSDLAKKAPPDIESDEDQFLYVQSHLQEAFNALTDARKHLLKVGYYQGKTYGSEATYDET